MKCRPKITVLIPVFNAEKFLAESVHSILNQTFENFELILIDDGSTDASFEIMSALSNQDSRIKLFKNQERLRISNTLNAGIALASGEYLARMDADDISLSNRLSRQLDFLEKNKEIDICGSQYEVIDENNKRIFTIKRFDDPVQIDIALHLIGNFIHHPSVMGKTDIFKEYLYDATKIAEDYDMWLRMIKGGRKIAQIKEPLVLYRQSQDQTTNLLRSEISEYRESVIVSNLKNFAGEMFTERLKQDHVDWLAGNKYKPGYWLKTFRFYRHITRLELINQRLSRYDPILFKKTIRSMTPASMLLKKIRKMD